MLATRPNPQVLYALSMGNEQSSHLGGLRARALDGLDGVAWIEWSMADDDRVDDRAVWIACNSGYPARISMAYMEKEFRALGPERFAHERLGKSAWPSGEPGEWVTVSEDSWLACARPGLLVGALAAPSPAPVSVAEPLRPESWPDGVPEHVTRGAVQLAGYV
jgi:hypothetical protein